MKYCSHVAHSPARVEELLPASVAVLLRHAQSRPVSGSHVSPWPLQSHCLQANSKDREARQCPAAHVSHRAPVVPFPQSTHV